MAVVVIVYGTLVASNIVLKMLNEKAVRNAPARRIEKAREIKEDRGLVKEARALGFLPYIYPDLFSWPDKANRDFYQVAQKHKLAPLGALPGQKTYYGNEGYGQLRFKTGRFGFRNRDEVWDRPDLIKVAVFGDSFAMGACVRDDKTITGLLQMRGRVTLNLAAGGNDPVHSAAAVKVFAGIVAPRHMVVVLYPNDNTSRPGAVNRYLELYVTGDGAKRVFARAKNGHAVFPRR